MVALSQEDRIRLGFGTPENPNVAVHFDLFPAIYFTETVFRVGSTIDAQGGMVFADHEEAKAYALKHFDDLMNSEIAKMQKQKMLIHDSIPEKYQDFQTLAVV